jgi:hypothetical protein
MADMAYVVEGVGVGYRILRRISVLFRALVINYFGLQYSVAANRCSGPIRLKRGKRNSMEGPLTFSDREARRRAAMAYRGRAPINPDT